MFNIIRVFDPKKGVWSDDQVVEQQQTLARVRELLGGRWTKSSGYLKEDGAAAFWNSANGRKVFVMATPRGLPREAVERIARAA